MDGFAQVVPFHAFGWLPNKEMMGANLFLAARVVDSAVPAALVKDVPMPKPTTISLFDECHKPIMDRDIMRATVSHSVWGACATVTLVVHETQRAEAFDAAISFHGVRIPNGTKWGKKSFSPLV